MMMCLGLDLGPTKVVCFSFQHAITRRSITTNAPREPPALAPYTWPLLPGQMVDGWICRLWLFAVAGIFHLICFLLVNFGVVFLFIVWIHIPNGDRVVRIVVGTGNCQGNYVEPEPNLSKMQGREIVN